MSEITNYTSYLDSRDITIRIAELEALETAFLDKVEGADAEYGREDDAELFSLRELAEQGQTLPDWEYGVTLVHDAAFADYTEEYARDTCGTPLDKWPFDCIDWDRAGRELQVDYTALDFNGQTYWAR